MANEIHDIESGVITIRRTFSAWNAPRLCYGNVAGNIAGNIAGPATLPGSGNENAKNVPISSGLTSSGNENAKNVPISSGSGAVVTAPIPGIVISIDVTVGQAVKRGRKLACIEAMKMENDITAEQDGTVTAIYAKPGDSLLEGARLLSIE